MTTVFRKQIKGGGESNLVETEHSTMITIKHAYH